MQLYINPQHLHYKQSNYGTQTHPIPSAYQVPSISLGEETVEEDIWKYSNLSESELYKSGKTMNYIKLRLESKNTGKKIDLNLVFNIKNVRVIVLGVPH